MDQPRVAIVHDYLWTLGGAEKVVEALAEEFPEAPIYTSFLLSDKMIAEGFQVDLQRVKTTWMQYLPFKRQLYKAYFLLYPLAFRSLNLKNYDIVITSSSYAAIHTTVAKETISEGNRRAAPLHICYCHTPSRYLYGYDTELDHAKLKKYFPFLEWLYSIVRGWDQKAAAKVDYFVTNSQETVKRIKKHYQRDSLVIYPPVDIDKFLKLTLIDKGYYFTYGRLVAHKRTDIIVQAFNDLGWPLKIAGSGLELENLKKMVLRQAQDGNIEFLGRVDDQKLQELLAGCTALIFAAIEDFGIVPVEAMAAGKPVIAYSGGGVLESVLRGRTGEFFSPQTAQGLKQVLTSFDPKKYDSRIMRAQAEKFAKTNFQSEFKKLTQSLWKEKTTAI